MKISLPTFLTVSILLAGACGQKGSKTVYVPTEVEKEVTVCGEGANLVEGVCIVKPVTVVSCNNEDGVKLVENKCVAEVSEEKPTISCDADSTELVGGVCVSLVEEVSCDTESTELVDGVCVAKSEPVVCGEGTELNEDSECVIANPTPKVK
ncbi:hypothetical protein [Pseudobacteriovorax antillogorgiicola]|uniref:Uncharacterized protein n=1 Tax=Pseudobacteriovorax antillogorgiicola TaxID=1513793 RepID=A0A1Y6CR15_9BACT|nr:hypothetical protein [Pseudobacteriovorax antillogorgiicola]TCS42740.1 hypothetical protein EDD56_1408 [Pseudobacteriovorax antillogorgiicola]SMF82204.1 hypothetical protein SAMN06296036_1408 [Pseudobacteriovorax antillogorgiicola]